MASAARVLRRRRVLGGRRRFPGGRFLLDAAERGSREQALASTGAADARCKLSAAQLVELKAVLDADPGVCGYADQCPTLVRIADQVWRRFGIEYMPAGMDVLLRGIG